ncbi:MAG: hypothetical protein ACRCSL_11890 [Microbacterium sp.]
MTEQPGEDLPPPRTRVDVAVALARMEAKLDVAIAQHQLRLDEHGRRIADLERSEPDKQRRLADVERATAAAKAASDAVAATKPAPVGLTTYVPIGISLVLLVLYLIEKYGA